MELLSSSSKSDTESKMQLSNVDSVRSHHKKKKILSEEEYAEKMEKIITKDFFPDLPKLKAQNEYLDALERGDVARLQEIQLTYQLTESTRSRVAPIRDGDSTPAAFETPDIRPPNSPARTEADFDTASVISVSDKTRTLDQFLSEVTSEDNASFQVIMEKSDILHQQKYPWLYKDENAEGKKLTDMLALTSTSETKAVEFKKPEPVTWAYKNRNALMYVPDGVEFTAEERLAQGSKIISHENTRFEMPPFDEEANKEAIAEAATLQAKMKEGRVGIDGKEIIPGESPQVNGYGFVGTPLPNPGVTDTPIMTWGEIEGTPFRLDGSDTPLPQNPGGQQFKIPNLSKRERIALSLADKAAEKHRKSHRSTPTNILSPALRLGSSTPLERLQSMSPAARRLAHAKLGIHRDADTALRASYSPSPLRTPNRVGTPSGIRTPQTANTPNVTPKPAVITLSETKTLLVPKRHKASDFF